MSLGCAACIALIPTSFITLRPFSLDRQLHRSLFPLRFQPAIAAPTPSSFTSLGAEVTSQQQGNRCDDHDADEPDNWISQVEHGHETIEITPCRAGGNAFTQSMTLAERHRRNRSRLLAAAPVHPPATFPVVPDRTAMGCEPHNTEIQFRLIPKNEKQWWTSGKQALDCMPGPR